MKRKKGFKEMVQWINRLGHGISYEEVASVKSRNNRASEYKELLCFLDPVFNFCDLCMGQQ